MVQILLAIIYVSFISLGLPDALLGSAWPSMYREMSVPVSYAGIISMIISVGTVISSLQSDRLTKKLGAGMVTAISVAMTAVALFGFSISGSFPILCLWAIPYGLGAGSVDAALNNYVALHYTSRDMSWLHCMWGGDDRGTLCYGICPDKWHDLESGIPDHLPDPGCPERGSVPESANLEKAGEESRGSSSRRRRPFRKGSHIERDCSDPGCEGDYGDFFLLLRRGTDQYALGQQLYGAP